MKLVNGNTYRVESVIATNGMWLGFRDWTADDANHAREQHIDSFPDETIVSVRFIRKGRHA